LLYLASVVPYKGFKTLDGDIFIGGANDRLFGIMCDKLGKPEWNSDPKYKTNNERVRNRAELEPLIEAETKSRTTKEWQDLFEGSGLPYAAVNDVMDTLTHPHGMYFPLIVISLFISSVKNSFELAKKADICLCYDNSRRAGHGPGNSSSVLWSYQGS
jgi:hypothetical protein